MYNYEGQPFSHDLDNLLERSPDLSRAFISILVERVRTAASHIEAVIFQDVLGRLAYQLLTLAARHGRPTASGCEIDLPLTQTDLATIVGATRESVNKSLTALRNKNLVAVDGAQILITDPDGLRRVIQERGR